jgi:hypothetical protein
MSDKIRVILFQEADQWLAQGIEHDICAQGPTKEEAFERFRVTMALESKEPGGLDRIEPAPKHFADMWQNDSADGDCDPEDAQGIDCRIAA